MSRADNRTWTDKNVSLPKEGFAIECKDKDGDVLVGKGLEQSLTLSDLLEDTYLLFWRYKSNTTA